MNDVQHYLRPGTLQLPALPPLSLYLHLPWCLKKCPYCDFNSHERRAGVDARAQQARYVDALLADLEASLPLVWGRPVYSVFIGGGTPSLFEPEQIDRLIAGARARLPLEPMCEITLEANPGTFERERFAAFRAAGVTRLSVGVQSFHDRHLKALGRVHDGAQARAALEEAARAFDTFNLDLMYALPGQTLAELEQDVRTALAFAPPHLSIYHLTIEPNTVFAKFPPRLPDDDTAWDMLDRITALTADAGLARYEVSAYARAGHRCVHNLNYWEFGDYLGIGAGAHGKLTLGAQQQVLRRWKVKHPSEYLLKAGTASAIGGDEVLSTERLPFDFMLNALRLNQGVPMAMFEARTGLPRAAIAAQVAIARERGWLDADEDWLRPTELGRRFANAAIGLFLD